MLWVIGISEYVKELVITRHPAAVFGRAGSFAGDAQRVFRPFLLQQYAFEEDIVRPTVTKIIVVNR